MKCKCQFNCAEVATKVSTGFTHCLHDEVADLTCEQVKVTVGKWLQVSWGVDLLEEHCGFNANPGTPVSPM